MIKTSGHRVSPPELEEALVSSQGITNAVVIVKNMLNQEITFTKLGFLRKLHQRTIDIWYIDEELKSLKDQNLWYLLTRIVDTIK